MLAFLHPHGVGFSIDRKIIQNKQADHTNIPQRKWLHSKPFFLNSVWPAYTYIVQLIHNAFDKTDKTDIFVIQSSVRVHKHVHTNVVRCPQIIFVQKNTLLYHQLRQNARHFCCTTWVLQ